MTISDPPLISAIVCTYNRPTLLRRALDSVLLQELKNFEVIIVDDGSDSPVELPAYPKDRFRLIRTEHRGVGAARAEGVNAARGEFVAYCDDDDEWTPSHLSTLLKYLQGHPNVDLVYADSKWVQEGAPPTVAYSIDYDALDLSEGNYIFASDVMHRASAARDVGGFDQSLQAYEDWDLWLRMRHIYTLRHLPVVLGSHYWHEDCVSVGDNWKEWGRVYQNQQDRLSLAGADGRPDLIVDSTKITPFDRATWQQGRRELIWRSVLRPETSFGHVAHHLLVALEREGVDVTLAPTRNQPVSGLEYFYKPLDHWGRLGFYYHHNCRVSALPCQRVIVYSMWETTSVPKDQIEEINKAATLLYVPCRQHLESFQECGVHIPSKVLHHGVDATQFPYLQRDPRDLFVFGSFGDLSLRKGTDVLIRAFQDEFSAREPVRLLLKSSVRSHAYEMKDPRITLISGFMNQSELLDYLRDVDVFVLPSRGEGFGLCGLEAMSTGLPVIATNWSGPVEYLDPEYSFPLRFRLVDAKGIEANSVRYFGQWAEPDYEHLRYLLRWVYEHQEEAAEKGRRAAEVVHKQWTWDRLARQIIEDLDGIAGK